MMIEGNIDTHHIDYSRIGNERFGDLIVICRSCHKELHDFIDKLVVKGFAKRRVMDRLKPYCVRKLLKVHKIFDDAKKQNNGRITGW